MRAARQVIALSAAMVLASSLAAAATVAVAASAPPTISPTISATITAADLHITSPACIRDTAHFTLTDAPSGLKNVTAQLVRPSNSTRTLRLTLSNDATSATTMIEICPTEQLGTFFLRDLKGGYDATGAGGSPVYTPVSIGGFGSFVALDASKATTSMTRHGKHATVGVRVWRYNRGRDTFVPVNKARGHLARRGEFGWIEDGETTSNAKGVMTFTYALPSDQYRVSINTMVSWRLTTAVVGPV